MKNKQVSKNAILKTQLVSSFLAAVVSVVPVPEDLSAVVCPAVPRLAVYPSQIAVPIASV